MQKTNNNSYDSAPAAGADADSVLEARLAARAGWLLDEAPQGDFVLENDFDRDFEGLAAGSAGEKVAEQQPSRKLRSSCGLCFL